jgi:hypothetical protein
VRRGGDCPSPGRCRVRRLLLFEQGLRRRLPARSRDARARVWRHRSVGCEGHAPVVAVLLASAKRQKAGESIAAPKGHGPRLPAAFPLQIGTFLGNHAGATMAIVDPSGWHPQLARGGGRGHAPVVAVLLLQAGLTAGAGSVGWPGTRQAERSQTWPVRSAPSRLPRPSRRRRRRPSDRRRLRAASSQRSRRHRPRCPFAAGGSRCSSRSAWLSLFGGAATGTGERCRARRPRDTP